MKYRFTILLTSIRFVSIVCIGSMYVSAVNQLFPLVYLIVIGPLMLFEWNVSKIRMADILKRNYISFNYAFYFNTQPI